MILIIAILPRLIFKGDDLIKIAKYANQIGYDLSYGTLEILLMMKAKDLIKEIGITKILSMQLITEEVLPDNTQKNVLLDTLKYKLNRIAPVKSLLIIDPYLYPNNPDTDYESYFISIFGESIEKCNELNIITSEDRNTTIESSISKEIKSVNPNIKINTKYSKVFHDRFWIADEARGLFVGTSLNGIGRRYAIIDYLDERDSKEIVQRCKNIR